MKSWMEQTTNKEVSVGSQRRRCQDSPVAAHSASSAPVGMPEKRLFSALALLTIGLVISTISVSAKSADRPTGPTRSDHGQVLFRQYCAACHGSSGQGEFNWQNRERGAPALDSSGHAWHHEDAQLLSMILDKPVPDSKMPAWRGALSPDDALDVIAYIKTLWTPYIRANCQGAKHMRCMGHR